MVWSLHSILRNIARLEKNLEAENLHPPSDPLVTAIFSKEAALRHCTLTIILRSSRAYILICPYLNPWQSTFLLYTCLGVQAVPSLRLPCLVSAFHKPPLYCRVAGQSWAMLSHWKLPSDSNFTVPYICIHLPLSMPKEQSWWQRVCNCMSFLAPHGTLPCDPLLQWRVLLQSSGMAGTSNPRVLAG